MAIAARILAPVEFSDRCMAAARYAGWLAGQLRAELTILHVVAPFPPEAPADVALRRTSHLAQQLDQFLSAEPLGTLANRVLLHGDPAAKIVAYAHEQRSDLIVMATHGFGPFRRFILGSNTAKVLHDAECPVWTGVHMEEMTPGSESSIANILCAVDLGPQTAKVLGWALELRRRFDAHLVVLHAVLAIPSMMRGPESNWNVVMRAAAQKELEQIRDDVGASCDLAIEAGEPAQVIAAEASRLQADVVVIGRGSAAGTPGRLRTNAYAIIRQSPCPVVSV